MKKTMTIIFNLVMFGITVVVFITCFTITVNWASNQVKDSVKPQAFKDYDEWGQ